MSPRWLYWPDVVSLADFTASGTTDVADGTGGSRDNDPTTNPSEADLSFITFRGTDNASPRMFFVFSVPASRDTFVSNYPDGSSLALVLGGSTYTASSISWNSFDSGGSGYCLLSSAQFDSWPANVPSGTSYTFEIFV